MENTNYNCRMPVLSICLIIFAGALEVRAATWPPDADNAALLYYQAYILRLDFSDFRKDFEREIDKAVSTGEPTNSVREYVDLSSQTVELAQAASRLPSCDWGGRYSVGLEPKASVVGPLAAFLGEVLGADAQILAIDGDYRKALGQCLAMRRLAAQVGDDTYTFFSISAKTDGLALHCIQNILAVTPQDADTLAWLKHQLGRDMKAVPSLARILQTDADLHFLVIQKDDRPTTSLQWLRKQLVARAKSQDASQSVRDLTDEQLLMRCRERYNEFLDSSVRVLNDETPYAKKYEALERLSAYWEKAAESDLFAKPAADDAAMPLGLYSIYVRHVAYVNAVTAAVDVYLAKATSGELPRVLLDGLPKDPFSDEDFEYRVTGEGFVLRCRYEDIGAPLVRYDGGKRITSAHFREYEFKAR